MFLYDAFPGGSGVSERLFGAFPDLAEAAFEMVTSCRCRSGCPSCAVSPKCSSGYQPLDRGTARDMLAALVRVLRYG